MLIWHPAFETGHAEIDRDHREICHRLNQIEIALQAGAGREQIAEIVGVLQRYTLIHFSKEENVMACAKCPRHGDNCAAHAKFAARLDRWLEVLTIPGMTVTVLADVHAECCRWLQQHLTHIDSGLRQSMPPFSSVGTERANDPAA
jgi:hemerythrin